MKFGLVFSFLVVFFPGSSSASKKWSGSSEVSYVNSKGNANSWTFGGKLHSNYSGDILGLDLDLGVLSSKSRGQVDAEEYEVSQKARWMLGAKFYVFERIGWDQSRPAGIHSRIDATAGGGLKWTAGGGSSLSAELAGGVLIEDRTASNVLRFPAGRMAFKGVLKLGLSAHISQSLNYTLDLKKTNNYRAASNTSLVSAISKRFSVKISFQWKRSSPPPATFLRDDFRTMSALILSY